MRQPKGLPPKEAPLLPSDRDPAHVYGKPSSLKTEEEVRATGCAADVLLSLGPCSLLSDSVW